MKHNIFVSTTFLSDGKSLHDALVQIKHSNIFSVEIGSNHCFEDSYDYVSDFPFQYLVHNYFPIPKESFVLNIASLNDGIRERSISHIKTAIDFASDINAKLYTFHPGFLKDPAGPNQSSDNYDFVWRDSNGVHTDYEDAWQNMISAFKEVINYANKKKIQISFETEGSMGKKNFLMMQRPEEYKRLMNIFSPDEIGINLNIGHLNLASRAFNFEPMSFVDMISSYICAMELSHNNGIEDQHLPLVSKEWYWSIINDKRFKKACKILEYRDVGLQTVQSSLKMFEAKL